MRITIICDGSLFSVGYRVNDCLHMGCRGSMEPDANRGGFLSFRRLRTIAGGGYSGK